jgi:hypothetical protein
LIGPFKKEEKKSELQYCDLILEVVQTLRSEFKTGPQMTKFEVIHGVTLQVEDEFRHILICHLILGKNLKESANRKRD